MDLLFLNGMEQANWYFPRQFSDIQLNTNLIIAGLVFLMGIILLCRLAYRVKKERKIRSPYPVIFICALILFSGMCGWIECHQQMQKASYEKFTKYYDKQMELDKNAELQEKKKVAQAMRSNTKVYLKRNIAVSG